MSAVSWDEVAVDLHALGAPAGVGVRRARHLSLVPADATVESAGSAAGGFRLTRRGRLALSLVVLLLAVVTAVAGTRMATASAVPVGPVAASTVTVAAGETLSEIALRELPSLSIAEGMAQIRLANNLSTTAISAGETLIIPKL